MAAMKSCSSLLVTAIILMIAFSPTVTGQTSGPCDNTLNNVTQIITSKGYPYSNYPNNANCQWSISAQVPTQVIVLSLVYFSLEGTSPSCAYDYVTINDASNTTAITNQIKKICGLVSASKFISNGPIMIIEFHSDSSNTAAGFKFEYTAQNRSELCGSTTLPVSYGYMRNFVSPGYPNAYVSNLDCQWTIRSDSSSYVIVLNLLDLMLESENFDNLTIYDGPSSSSPVIQTLGNTVPASQFISTGPSMTLVFQTDDSSNYKGFSFQYQYQLKSTICGSNTLSAYSYAQSISSPGYPNYYYPRNMNCQWIISSYLTSNVVVLKVIGFNIASSPSCTSDSVTIYDGYGTSNRKILTTCGQLSSGQYQSTGSYMTVVFSSDNNGSASSFQFQYTSRDRSTLCSNSALGATSFASEIKSPNYPGYYSSDTDCEWHITADISTQVIVLKVLDFELEGTAGVCSSAFDYVSIFDGSNSSSSPLEKLCGDQTTTMFVSTGSSMTIKFHTDGSTQKRGFKLEYTSSVKSAVCTGDTLTASWGINYLSSPNFPGAYPMNLDCRWQIQAGSSSDVVVLEVDRFNVEGSGAPCYSDYVTIYDGPTIYSSPLATLCGLKFSGTYRSTGSDMTVAFHSNGVSSSNTGFSFTYKSRSKSTDYSYSSGLGPGAIAGIVICSIGVPFLIVVFVIVLIKRNAAQRQTRTRVPVQNGGVTAVPAVSYVANNQQAYPNQYATVQNPQGVNMGAPGYNTSYYPPPYQYNMPPASAPQGQTPILNNPGPGPSMGVAPTQGDEGHFNKGFIS
jgi:cubilin